jgi:sulfate adenylyltransferase subunit 2
MIEFRDRYCREEGLDLKVWINQQGLAQGINPFDHRSKTHTDIMKTAALKQALNHYQYGWRKCCEERCILRLFD